MNGHGEAHVSHDAVKGHINKGEEEEMEIIGYRESLPRKLLTWLGFLLTVGLLRLAIHWWPQLDLYCAHRRCPLKYATKILVIDVYERRFKSLFVKEVKTISSTKKLRLSTQEDGMGKLAKQNDELLMRVHLADGTVRDMKQIRMVNVKKLTFIWIDEKCEFVRLVGLDNGRTKEDLRGLQGCTKKEQQIKRIVYGNNYIEAPIQSYVTLVVLEVLNPFYVFQVFSLCIWFSDEYYWYGAAIIIMSVFGISTSVIQTHKNQKNLHDTINQIDTVTVRRADGQYEDVATTEIVPGDVIVVTQGSIASCDGLLLNGSCVVNESMLTGESVPVTKSFVRSNNMKLSFKDDAAHILFCGTQVIQTRKSQGKGGESEVLALVLRTGFMTSKGSLVRSILYPPPADYKFDSDSYKFIWFLALMGVSGTLFTIYYKASANRDLQEIIIRSLDLLTIAIPVALPAATTVGKIFAVSRLKKKHISCINSRVINVSGSIDCLCFDKTGTLTEDGMDLRGVLPATGGAFSAAVSDASQLPEEAASLLYGMATCHSLTIIDSEVIGDPLETKMFEATGWILAEPDFPPSSDDSEPTPIAIAKPPKDRFKDEQLELLHQFQFSSQLQRMSVVARKSNGEMAAYCKGSPEAIVSLSQPMTVPSGTMERLKEYTAQGFRVIAMAWKPVPSSSYRQIVKSPREDLEKDLRFVGFIIMENRLKVETKPTIRELQEAKMKVVMITGDNILTAICVAKECGILGNTPRAAEIDLNEKGQLIWRDLKPLTGISQAHIYQEHSGEDIKRLLETSRGRGYEIAATGKAWALIRETRPGLVPKLVESGVIFARMGPDQKQQVITEVQNLGFVVAMCGDGANDCGALKAANVGISLSEAEASVASPFTSQIRNISCVLQVVREGRAALVTAFGICKFMILYSFTEFFSTMLLYTVSTNLTDFQFLYIDVFLIVNFAFLFGRDEAFKGRIVAQPPQSTLISLSPILSMVFQAIVVGIFQVLSLIIIKRFPWFEPFQYTQDEEFACFENYAVYAVSQFQYITLAIVCSRGHPYRERFYKNTPFFASVLIMTAICIYITVYPFKWIISLFEFRFPPNAEFPWAVVGLGFAGFVISILLELFVVQYLLERKLKLVSGTLLKRKLISSSEIPKLV